jgi:protein-S-isoprenylcysteine O-methyltransferase Ste14
VHFPFLPPPAIYVTGFLVGLGLETLAPMGGIPAPARFAAGALGVVLWLYFDGSAMVQFKRARTGLAPSSPNTALVTSGPYRLSRNPMYVGMALLYAGLALALDLLWPLALLPAVLLIVDRLFIAREEPLLEAAFGEAYRRYRARVRRWL